MLERYRLKHILIFAVTLATIFHSVLGCEPCEFAVFTVSKVDFCPEDENEWADRAAKKNCELYAHQQKCSVPEKFKYHCAVDELEKKIVELCAKEHLITDGKCTEYNEKGKTIQEHRIVNNTDVKPSCPDNYWSSEAYRCKGCNDFVRKRTYTPMKKDCECGSNDGCLYHTIVVIIETSIIVAVVVAIILYNFPKYISKIPWIQAFRNRLQHEQQAEAERVVFQVREPPGIVEERH